MVPRNRLPCLSSTLGSGSKVTETYLLDAAEELHWLVRLEQKKADAVVVERVFRREAR
jgi:hypothetical protein